MGNEHYDLSRFLRPGRLIIFNHERYDDEKYHEAGQAAPSKRTGTEVDKQRLMEVFQDLNFVCKKYDDLRVKEIEAIVHKLILDAEMSYKDHGCVVLVVLTHGTRGGWLMAHDGAYHQSALWQPLVASKSLRGKPKIFIFQACRDGEDSPLEMKTLVTSQDVDVNMSSVSTSSQQAENVDSAGKSSTTRLINEKIVPSVASSTDLELMTDDPVDDMMTNCSQDLPNSDEVLLAYSTVDNRSSIRSEDTGSWYMEILTSELRAWPEESLLTILTKVNAMLVAEKSTSHPEQQEDTSQHLSYGQTATFVSFLGQDIVFSGTSLKRTRREERERFESVKKRHAAIKRQRTDGSKYETDAAASFDDHDEVPERFRYSPCNYQGRAFVLCDRQHENEATEFENIARSLRLYPVRRKSSRESISHLSSVLMKCNFARESCLVVAVFSSLSEESVLADLLDLKTSLHASVCTSLAGKPKICLVVDVHMGDGRNFETDGGGDFKYATDSSDFMLIRGFGPAFKEALFRGLASCLDQQDLLSVATRAIRESKDASEEHARVESTLRDRVVFCSNVLPVPESQIVGELKSRLSFEIRDPVQYFVGREAQMQELHENLLGNHENRGPTADVLVHGPPRIGKTQCLYKYILKYGQEFTNIIILNAQDSRTLATSLEKLLLNCKPKPKNSDLKIICEHMKEYYSGKTLIIFENTNIDITNDIYIHPDFYYVIVSMRGDYESKFKMELPVFSTEEGREMTEKFFKRNDIQFTDEDLNLLFAQSGHLPMSLYARCCFIRSNNNRMQMFEDDPFDLGTFLTELAARTSIHGDELNELRTMLCDYDKNIDVILNDFLDFSVE